MPSRRPTRCCGARSATTRRTSAGPSSASSPVRRICPTNRPMPGCPRRWPRAPSPCSSSAPWPAASRPLKKAHLLRWRPRSHAQRTASTPRVRPSVAASHLDLFERPVGFSAPPLAPAEARRPLLEEGLQPLAHVAAHGAEDLVAVLERDGLVEAHVHVGAKSFFGEA